ncbi:hypothetical protein AMECASPLE_019973 [Ameca splendens]|uniref:Uncharacterized protein n=1 Tax=Ameca splendens TaxID=208324 RepID=A0ABV0Z2D2_9TELE
MKAANKRLIIYSSRKATGGHLLVQTQRNARSARQTALLILYFQLKVNKERVSVIVPGMMGQLPSSSSACMNQQQLHAATRRGDVSPRAEGIGENYPHYQWNLLPAPPTNRPPAGAAI